MSGSGLKLGGRTSAGVASIWDFATVSDIATISDLERIVALATLSDLATRPDAATDRSAGGVGVDGLRAATVGIE